MRRWNSILPFCLALLTLGCNGDSSQPIITVTVTPSTTTVLPTASVQFTATVSGTTNTTVNWLVNDVAGGNATVGTISSSGLYTAPSVVPSPAAVTVKATSQADSSKSGTATVTVDSGISVTLSPAAVSIGTSETQQFTATVAGTANLNVNWFVNDVAGGNTTFGQICVVGNPVCTTPGATSAPVEYRAPAAVPSPSAVTVKATSAADSTKSASGSVSIFAAAAPTLTSISPTRAAQGALFQDVYLRGTNFLTTSTVRFNGSPVQSTFINITLLRARLSSAQLGATGTFTIDVQQQAGATTAGFNFDVVPVRPAMVGPSPDSAAQGGGTVTINVNGGYFSPSVTAEFNGVPRITSLNPADARQMSVTLVGSADLSTAGLFPVVVRNPAAAAPMVATNFAVQPTTAPAFSASVTVGNNPAAVAVNTATRVAVVANRGSDSISLIDLSTNAVTSFPVGTAPTGVAVDNEQNRAVVANSGSNNISIVNLATGAVSATIPSPTLSGASSPLVPFAVGVNPLSGLALVANKDAAAATVIDLNTATVTGTVALTTGANPAVAIEPSLNWGIITPGGAGAITVVDLARRSVVATLGLGVTVRGIAVNTETQTAVLTDPGSILVNTMSLLDQSVTSLAGAAGQTAVAVNPLTNTAVTVNSTSNQAVAIDLRTPAAIGSVTVGTTPRAVAIDPVSNLAIVANEGSNNVTILDLGPIRPLHVTQVSPITARVSSSTPPPTVTVTVTGGGFVGGSVIRLDETPLPTTFVSSRRLTAQVDLAVFTGPRRFALGVENPGPVRSNVSEFTVMREVAVGTGPRAVAIDPQLDLAVVTNAGSNDVSVIDLNTVSVTSTLAVGTNPQGVAINSRAGRAVVTNRGSNTASFVDLTTGTVLAFTATVGSEPIGVAINPDDGTAVVANSASNTISLFSSEATSSPGTADTVAVDNRPVAVAIDVSRNLAAVAQAAQNSVALVNLTTRTISGRVSGPQLPTDITYDPFTDRFLVLSSLSNNLVLINPANSQASALRVGINPTSVAYNVNTATLVTVNSASNTISVMDFIDRRIRAILPLVGSQQFSVAIHPRTNLAVLVDEASNRVLLVPLPR